MQTSKFCFLILLVCYLVSTNVFAQPSIDWQNTIGGSNEDQLKSVQQTADGGYIFGGYSNSGISGDKTTASFGGFDYWIVKTSSTGIIEWQNTIGGNDTDYLTTILQTADGGYIAGGYSSSGISADKTEASMGGYDYWVVKLSSTGSIQWQNTIGGNSADVLTCILQTDDGNYVLGGNSSSGISGDKTDSTYGYSDYWILKLNSIGSILWQKDIGGSKTDQLTCLQQTSDGGYIAGGWSLSGISGSKSEESQQEDYWLVKLGAGGKIIWQNTIGGANTDELASVHQTSDGGYILGGNSFSDASGDKSEDSNGSNDFWIVRLTNTGNILWDETIGGSVADLCEFVTETDGGYLVIGYSESDSSGDKRKNSKGASDYWALKLNDEAEIQWQHTIGGNSNDFLNDCRQTADGGIIMVGTSESTISGDKTEGVSGINDYWVVKLSPCISLLQYSDTDSDGYGDPGNTYYAPDCMIHDGYVNNNFDCDDGIASVFPGSIELVNGLDDDCNGLADDVFCYIAEGPQLEWEKTIGGNDHDALKVIQQTEDGGYIIGGESFSGISGDKSEGAVVNDYWIVKLNASGDIEWENTIGGDHYDWMAGMEQTADGGYILGGGSQSGISGDKTEKHYGYGDYWVIKLNSTGDIEWQNTLVGQQFDIMHSVHQTADGGYILGGHSDSDISDDKSENHIGEGDYWIVKLNSLGFIEWDNTIGGEKYDRLVSAKQIEDGGYILAGYSESGKTGDKSEPKQGLYDYWILKLDGSGNIEWQNAIGGSGDDIVTCVEQTNDGGYVVGGYSNSGISGDKTEECQGLYDYWVVKLSSSGDIEWQNTIGGSQSDYLSEVLQTIDGNYLLGGSSNSGISGDKMSMPGNGNYWLLKLNNTGGIIWQGIFGGTETDDFNSIQYTADGGFIMGGSSESSVSGCKSEASASFDYWVVKLSAEPGSCPMPAAVQVADITDTKATISWTGNPFAYSYRIRKRPVGTDAWIYSSVVAPVTFKILSNNIPSTQYEVQVQSYCDSAKTDSSGYTVSTLFTSDSECPKPKSIAVTDISDTKATVSWMGSNEAYSYRIRKRPVGTTDWIYSSVTAPDTSKKLINNLPTTEYEIQVQAFCNPEKTDSSDYSASVIFITSGGCTGTDTQSTVDITSTSAKLSWSYTFTPDKWKIKYRPSSTTDWTTVKTGGTNTSYILTGLMPSTIYDWQIRAKCDGENSNWSTTQNFKTAPYKIAEVISEVSFSIYPNPAREEISILFTIGKACFVSMKVYDLNGKEMSTWFNGQMVEGEQVLSFDLSSFAKGIYFVRMISENGIQNQKLIVQ